MKKMTLVLCFKSLLNGYGLLRNLSIQKLTHQMKMNIKIQRYTCIYIIGE